MYCQPAHKVLRIMPVKRKTEQEGASKKRKTIIKSISLPKRVIEIGKARAKVASRTFSNHVSVLIENEALAAK